MEQPKIERVLRLMQLLTGNVNYTINDLADKLDTSYRSIYRYLDTFKDAGFVVQKVGDYYRLGKESKYFEDISQLVHFTDEEAYVVNNLIEGLDDNNILKQNLRKKLATVYDCTSMADCVVKGKNASNVHTLIDAMREKKQVILKNYASSHTEIIRDRLVEPFGFTTNYVQAWCYDLEDDKNKLFKLARMENVETIDNDWIAEDKHIQGYIDVFRISGYQKHNIKMDLGIMSHNLLLEEYPLAERDTKKIKGNRWLLETSVTSYAGPCRFYLGLADDIKIIGSVAFKKYIKAFIDRNIS